MSTDQGQGKPLTVKSRLFRENEFDYNGVAFVVTPLPFWRVPVVYDDLKSLVSAIFVSAETGSLPMSTTIENALTSFQGQLCKLLNECVKIPEEPEFDMRELPTKVIPRLLRIIFEQNFDLGEFKGLAQYVSWASIKEAVSQALESWIQLGHSWSTRDIPTAKFGDTPSQQ